MIFFFLEQLLCEKDKMILTDFKIFILVENQTIAPTVDSALVREQIALTQIETLLEFVSELSYKFSNLNVSN